MLSRKINTNKVTLKNIIIAIINVIIFLSFLWFILSFTEVQLHNNTMITDKAFNYSSWNFFTVFNLI